MNADDWHLLAFTACMIAGLVLTVMGLKAR